MRRVLPPTYVLVALLCMVALHLAWPVDRLLSYPLTLIGLVPILLGMALNVAADRAFKRHETTVEPFRTSTALVMSFPYSMSRNPMYLGIALIVGGVVLLLGTLSPLVPAVALMVTLHLRFVRTEERMLAETFGTVWTRYVSRVRRWL